MKITDVQIRTVPMSSSWLTERPVANPLSIYPEYAARRSSWYRTQTAGAMTVVLENGTEGHGFIGGSQVGATVPVLETQLRDLIVGKSCLQTELIGGSVPSLDPVRNRRDRTRPHFRYRHPRSGTPRASSCNGPCTTCLAALRPSTSSRT